ncbi:alpha/beta fold hydrolase [Xylocopilactobacillus apis]|uniref:Alpha/beta hydrolase n=1 Tax=Xylocopilactobacillus apis TaxID=2932183 RepID=A0AAU9CPM6_9LACO|nr:alpha/beta hydrolase [Xylocopilactobacillus apis]BDR55904.1 alpha/beta hydrolase [Xylocopilactobacillus apis]
MVFCNGFGGYQEIWSAQKPALIGHGYQMITWDYPGQGSSSGDIADNLIQLAQNLALIILKLDLRNPILIGHSMGASVIWNYLQNFGTDNIAGILTIDQSPKMINTPHWNFGLNGVSNENISEKLTTKFSVHETMHGLVPIVSNELADAKTKHPFNRSEAQKLLLSHFKADWRNTIERLMIPVQLITARSSPYFPNGYGEWLQNHNPQIRETIMENCGHDIMAEIPNQFNRSMIDFLKICIKKKSSPNY